jgi:hypothetical protein
MTNREQLEDAEILQKNLEIAPQEEAAIEKLTPQDLDLLRNMKKRFKGEFDLELLLAPPTHHIAKPE